MNKIPPLSLSGNARTFQFQFHQIYQIYQINQDHQFHQNRQISENAEFKLFTMSYFGHF